MKFRNPPITLCSVLFLGLAFAATTPAADDHATVRIFGYGRDIELSQEIQELLLDQVTEMVESSSFAFGTEEEPPEAAIKDLQKRYRSEVSGKYLLVSCPKTQTLKYPAGEITAIEVVVGLNYPQYASSLFAIDSKGRLIGLGKFHGGFAIEVYQTVEALVSASKLSYEEQGAPME